MKESYVQEKIRKWLLGQPFPVRVRKLADRFTRGYPDLQAIFRYNGHLVLLEIEVKSATGREQPIQRAEAKLCLHAAGADEGFCLPFPLGKYIRCVARSIEDVQAELLTHGIAL